MFIIYYPDTGFQFSLDEILNFKNLFQNQFPSQTNATWKVIASNIQRIQRKKSNQAACIVFVHKSSTSKGKGYVVF